MQHNDEQHDAVLAHATGVFGVEPDVRRTAEGVSSVVYRLDCNGTVAYLRLGETADEDLTTDALLLDHLRQLGLSVPQVVDVDPFNERLQRSVLVMSEIPGVDLGKCENESVARRVAYEAGRELAMLNSVEVDGWGWIIRDGSWPMKARWNEQAMFATSELPDVWPGRLAAVLTTPLIDAIAHVFAATPTPAAVGHLAHGDFDCTPVFQAVGHCTGLIDFGEIRGAELTFDLGHFLLHDGETARWSLFDDLLVGYAEINPEPTLDRPEIQRSAIQLGTRQLARWMNRVEPTAAATIPVIRTRVEQLEHLLLSHV